MGINLSIQNADTEAGVAVDIQLNPLMRAAANALYGDQLKMLGALPDMIISQINALVEGVTVRSLAVDEHGLVLAGNGTF